MSKIQYWSKVLLELDTDTGKIRILKGFHQPGAGQSATKKKQKQLSTSSAGTEYI